MEDQFPGATIPLVYHFQMLTDEIRMLRFQRAIQEVVPQGGRVLELGGGTGAFSYYAALRAAKVWCVECLPPLVDMARKLLSENPHPGVVEVVEADAMEYLPPEPVDVVICEMLHSALLRERQVEMIDSFQRRYHACFGDPLPKFIPEATVLGIQPVEQQYDFFGYHAKVPIFENVAAAGFAPAPLGPPLVSTIIHYDEALPRIISYRGKLEFDRPGKLNALRFITNNVLALNRLTNATITWPMMNLILPLPTSQEVGPGSPVEVRFDYPPGSGIEQLAARIQLAAPAS